MTTTTRSSLQRLLAIALLVQATEVKAEGFEPLEWFSAVQVVVTTDALRVRSGPSLSSTIVDIVERDRTGFLIAHGTATEQDGFRWWNVAFDSETTVRGIRGWVAEGDATEGFIMATTGDSVDDALSIELQSRAYTALVGVVPVDVAAGARSSYTLMSDGTVLGWGYGWGPLPTRVPGVDSVTQIAVGHDHVLALRDDGTVVAWGRNARGQLGVGHAQEVGRPVVVEELSDVGSIAAGRYVSIAVLGDGTVLTWGDPDFAYGVTYVPAIPRRVAPQAIDGLPRIVRAAAGHEHMYGIDEFGVAWMWSLVPVPMPLLDRQYSPLGWRSFDQDGITFTDPDALTVDVLHDPPTSVDVTHWSGERYVVRLAANGSVTYEEWEMTVPRRIDGLPEVRAIEASDEIVTAIAVDGTVFAWTDSAGGNDRIGLSMTPTRVLLPDDVTLLTTGGRGWEGPPGFGLGAYLHAVTRRGQAWTWGAGLSNGPWAPGANHGTGAEEVLEVPVQIPTLNDVATVAAGRRHSLALMTDGTIVGWGENEHGQVGDGTLETRFTPSRAGRLGSHEPVRDLAELVSMDERHNDLEFFLAENGVTVMCPKAAYGERGTVGDVTYTKRTRATITADNAATSCTSGIPWMAYMFSRQPSFDADIGHWDTSAVMSMDGMFYGASSFDRDLTQWDLRNVTTSGSMFADATSMTPSKMPLGVRPLRLDPPATTGFRENASGSLQPTQDAAPFVTDGVEWHGDRCGQAVYEPIGREADKLIGMEVEVSTEMPGFVSVTLIVRISDAFQETTGDDAGAPESPRILDGVASLTLHDAPVVVVLQTAIVPMRGTVAVTFSTAQTFFASLLDGGQVVSIELGHPHEDENIDIDFTIPDSLIEGLRRGFAVACFEGSGASVGTLPLAQVRRAVQAEERN